VADSNGRGRPWGAPAEPHEPGTVRIGSIGGVSVFVRTSWLLVAVLIAYVVAPSIDQVAPGLGAWKYVAGVAFAVLLTLSLLLHEVSHALVSKAFGIGVRSITLHFLGGVTAIDGEPKNPGQELAISAVGPITSLAIGGLSLALLPFTPGGLLTFVVGGLAGANLIVGVINLLPGMPLDGGRVLRAAVWKLTGNPHTGTTAAGWGGRVIAVLCLVSPALFYAAGFQVGTFDFLFALVFGWFLWTAATTSIVSGRVRARLPSLQARTLARRTVTVDGDLPLSEALRRAHDEQAGSVLTVDSRGDVTGIVSEAAVLATPADRQPWMPVSAVTRTIEPGLTLPVDLNGEQLIRAMQENGATEYVLVEADGEIYGVLSTADVDAAFAAGAAGGA
jgi:Zn-dependent protease/CBS domain-containing protein